MTAIAVLGAGGKMGLRITRKLNDAPYDVRAVEIAEAGRQRLAEAGIAVVEQDAALEGADVVVLAVPDTLIAALSRAAADRLPAGKMLLVLDAAAPFAGALPQDRPDLTYFLGHPCHPPLFNDFAEMAERKDFHGGIAPQSIVCALMQGPEEHYALGEAVCRTMWAPIVNAYRVTVEQMAILEPGLSEMVALPFIDIMHKAVDACAARGVPRQAAFDFLIGHLNVELAMWFGYSPRVPSDAAERLLRWATPHVVKDDWQAVLDPALILQACRLIADEQAAS